MAEVALDKVVKAYGTNRVIHGIDLAIRSGEFVVFVGPSGAILIALLQERVVGGLTAGGVKG